MKPLLLLLLAGACLAYTPITERSWVKFKNVQVPTYNSSLLREAPNIIYATEILIEERLNQVSKMIDKSLQDFHTHVTFIARFVHFVHCLKSHEPMSLFLTVGRHD